MTHQTLEKLEIEKQLTAAKDELVDHRAELQNEMFEQIEDLIVRVANLEQIAKESQSSKFRLERREREEKFKREAAGREANAAERARDRCTLEETSDPEKYKAYLAEELQKTG